jgi:hypothetical protein
MNTQLEYPALGGQYGTRVGRAKQLRGCINNAEVASVFDSRLTGHSKTIHLDVGKSLNEAVARCIADITKERCAF